jgi:glycosyltransferase involved in cell wall biosynthesis
MDLLDLVGPTRVIPRTGHAGLLRRILTAETPCFPTLADIFQPVPTGTISTVSGLKQRVGRFRQRSAFSRKHAIAIGNHGLNASRSLHTELGVSPDRIVPWEWTRLEPDPTPRNLRPGRPKLFFAGTVTEAKGTGDIVEAARLLRETGQDVDVTICGAGDQLDHLSREAQMLGLSDRVRFLGRVPLREVGRLMRDCDIVVVPSRHSYPEGMPNVIFEAMAARTPLVVSDHPAFRGRLIPGRTCVMYRASDPEALAAAITSVVMNPALYHELSVNSAAALRDLYVGTSWYTLIERFLEDPEDRSGWVESHSLRAVLAATGSKENGEEIRGVTL